MKFSKVFLGAFAAAALAVSVQAQNQGGQVVFRTPQEAVKYYEDLVSQLSLQVRTVQDDNAKMAQVVNELQRQMQTLNQNNQTLSQEIANLKKLMAAEASARQEQLRAVVDKVKGAISSAAAAERASAEKAAASRPSEMIEYTVQPGATLSLIASTFKVSVEEIRKANNLKSDVIMVGQKLMIPKR
jgi:LysM repeat protein